MPSTCFTMRATCYRPIHNLKRILDPSWTLIRTLFGPLSTGGASDSPCSRRVSAMGGKGWEGCVTRVKDKVQGQHAHGDIKSWSSPANFFSLDCSRFAFCRRGCLCGCCIPIERFNVSCAVMSMSSHARAAMFQPRPNSHTASPIQQQPETFRRATPASCTCLVARCVSMMNLARLYSCPGR
jgi:hypothetical protein